MARKSIAHTSLPILLAARANRRMPTPAEKKLWEALRGGKISGAKFRRQQPWGHFVLDFFCLAKMLVIEVDGSIHDDPEYKDMDAERTRQLSEAGICVIRFSNDEIFDDLESVLRQIYAHIHRIGEAIL